MMSTDPLALSSPMPVPASYAEKAMASLMQLHSELMDEKERRVELYRQLMEKEQALAELKLYVKLLEEKSGPPPAARPPSGGAAAATADESARASAPPPSAHVVGRRVDGWKVW